MKNEDFKKYLSERYQPQISWYDNKSIYNQKMYKWLQFFLIVFSSLTPILIIIEKLDDFKEYESLFWLPVTTAVLVAFITSLLKVYRYQENWINYRTTCETLKEEFYYYESANGEYADMDDSEKLFIERVESLISRENTLWLTAHKLNEKRDKK